jgi:hypothetical protein
VDQRSASLHKQCFSVLSLSERVRRPVLQYPEVLDFGRIAINAESTQDLIIGNAGDAPLTVQNLSIAGERFNVAFEEAAVIQPGEELSFAVSFSPTEARDYQAVLTIVSNDPVNPEADITLTVVVTTPTARRFGCQFRNWSKPLR